MATKSVDPTAEEFCRIVALMVVETARQGARRVIHKLGKKSKKNVTRK